METKELNEMGNELAALLPALKLASGFLEVVGFAREVDKKEGSAILDMILHHKEHLSNLNDVIDKTFQTIDHVAGDLMGTTNQEASHE